MNIKQKREKFQKSLTKEEIDAPSYLDWSNERLGQLVRLNAEYIATKTINGYESVTIMSALFLLCSLVDSANAGSFECELSDVTSEQHPEPTNWKITVNKIVGDKKKSKAPSKKTTKGK